MRKLSDKKALAISVNRYRVIALPQIQYPNICRPVLFAQIRSTAYRRDIRNVYGCRRTYILCHRHHHRLRYSSLPLLGILEIKASRKFYVQGRG